MYVVIKVGLVNYNSCRVIKLGGIFYDNKTNTVYNQELEFVGKRIHDKDCPFCKTDRQCWFYVDYNISEI